MKPVRRVGVLLSRPKGSKNKPKGSQYPAQKGSVPIVCPKCDYILLKGVHKCLEEAGYDVYCPYCKKWSHIKGTKEK